MAAYQNNLIPEVQDIAYDDLLFVQL